MKSKKLWEAYWVIPFNSMESHVFWRNLVWNRKRHSMGLNGIIWEFCKFCKLRTQIVDFKQTSVHFPTQSFVPALLHSSQFLPVFYSKIRCNNYTNYNSSNNYVFCFFKISDSLKLNLPSAKRLYVCRLLSQCLLSTRSSEMHFLDYYHSLPGRNNGLP